MIADPIRAMQFVLRDHLRGQTGAGSVELDAPLGREIPWRPHVSDIGRHVGWQVHPAEPDSDSWHKRLEKAQKIDPKLNIGIATTEEIVRSSEFLLVCQRARASIILMKERRDDYVVANEYGSVADLVIESGLKLDVATASAMLDYEFNKSLAPGTKAEKGVALEVVVGLLLSQVDDFEVSAVGVSNRTQQMDVLVHNRRLAGVLGGSPLVLAEAKNWTGKVTPTEYAAFHRKLTTRHRRAKLGFLVTTGKFTSGLELERRRDSKEETLIVFLDGISLPKLWQGSKTITKNIEQAVIGATVGK